MSEEFTYHEYVEDEKFLAEYNAYQARYASTIRESDKVIISMVRDLVEQSGEKRLKVLDIGCSTGNLLMHMKEMVPNADYTGGDLAESSLDNCRQNQNLKGIDFVRLDIMDIPENRYDVIVVNAVLYMFSDEQYEKALSSLSRGLTKDGRVIVYDFAHPFVHQKLTIYETSLLHPDGLRLCFRPLQSIRESASGAGFAEIEFYPFELPIDLPKPGYDEEVVTYTVKDALDHRMMFRGALFQPWCHMIARKG